jgi:glycosyltransferase involved in cell wall biosynthesis
MVCISPINWDEVWEGPQEIASRFASAGWQVFFVENIASRPPRFNWHDAERIGARIKRLAFKSPIHTKVPTGVEVHTPVTLPACRSSWIRKAGRELIIAQIKRQLAKRGVSSPVVWTYNPSAMAQAVCRALDSRLLIYCCVHDFASLSPQQAHLADEEERLLEQADIVFVLSEKLFAEKRAGRTNVFRLPQGANLQHYLDCSPEKTVLGDLPRPIVGYIGTIHEWVDQQLLKRAALAKPDWTFVLIGPERVSTTELRRLRNVVFLGPKKHEELPSYVAGFDAGIIPYMTGGFAETIRPNKVLEYLVMGKPVVTTRLPELDSLRDHLFSCDSAQQFIQALELAMDSDSEARRMVRREVAIANSMEPKFGEIESLVLAKLGQADRSCATIR